MDPEISKSDCLTNPVFMAGDSHQEQFDIVVSMPPFAVKNWGHDDAKYDPFNRFKRGMPPKASGDYAFISHMLASVRESRGRMAIVLPQGVLYRGAREADIREAFIKDNLLDAVIVLPEKLLINTNNPLAILIFNKDKTDENVLFIDASHDFDSGKITNTLLPEHISKITQTYKKRENRDKYATLATLADIEDNNYNCNIPRYVDSNEEKKPVELSLLNSNRKNLLKELAEVDSTISQYVNELNVE